MKTDPGTLFRDAETVRAPDLWDQVIGRVPGPSPRDPVGRRIAIIAFAFAIAVAGAGFGLSVYNRGARGPLDKPRPPASPAPIQTPTRVKQPLFVRDLGEVGPLGQVTDVLWAFGNPWVTYYDNKGSHLVRIDPGTGRPTGEVIFSRGRRLSEDSEWGGGALTSFGDSIWAGGGLGPYRTGQAALFRIDPSTARITDTYPMTGRAVVDVAFDGQSLWALVSPQPLGGEYEVVQIDPSTGSILARYPYAAAWTKSVLVAGGAVWVSERKVHNSTVGGAFIHQLDPGTAQDVIVGGSFAEPFSSGEAIWLPGGGPPKYQNGANTLVEIAPGSGDVLARWDVGGIGYDIGATPDAVWFFGSHGVEMLDATSGRLSIGHMGGTPIALSVGSGGVWVVTYEGHLVLVGIRSR